MFSRERWEQDQVAPNMVSQPHLLMRAIMRVEVPDMSRILLVEDEDHLCGFISKWLRDEMHIVDVCESGVEALEILARETYDAIVLDIMLPGLDGIEVCKRFRQAGGTTPIVMLTAKRTLESKLNGLDSGADDYLTKPFKLKELSARLRAVLRRQPALVSTILQAGDLSLNPSTGKVFRGEEEIHLGLKEFNLLEVLLRHAGILVTTDNLIESVWGLNSNVSNETIRSYIRLLRQKVDRSKEDSVIETVHGLGYRLRIADV